VVSECAVFCDIFPGKPEGVLSLQCAAKLCVRRDEVFFCVQCVATMYVGIDAGSISVQCVAKLSVRRNEWSLSVWGVMQGPSVCDVLLSCL
jgi:hypothetical protein